MPFTVAHVAAALPFRRAGFVWPALVIGTMAPDFEYLLRLDVVGRIGHGIPGLIVFTLPVALAALWLFVTFVRNPAIALLPGPVECRLGLEPFRWQGAMRFLNILVSLLIGILTHVAWDFFTHRDMLRYSRSDILQGNLTVPTVVLQHFKLLQWTSSAVGMTLLGIAFFLWFRRTGARREPSAMSSARRLAVIAGISVLSAMAAFARASAVLGFPPTPRLQNYFVVRFAVCSMAFFALGILFYGVWKTLPKRKNALSIAVRQYGSRRS